MKKKFIVEFEVDLANFPEKEDMSQEESFWEAIEDGDIEFDDLTVISTSLEDL